MGTHPIFESDFDCLTDLVENARRQIYWSRFRHRRSRWIWSWNRNCVRIFDHRLCPEPLPQGPALFLRHFGIRPFRGYGTFLLDGRLPYPSLSKFEKLLEATRIRAAIYLY